MSLPIELQEQLIESSWSGTFGQEIPRLRFFTPSGDFWATLKLVQLKNDIKIFIDCGTGNGDLPKEAQQHDIKMAGVDVIRRQGNSPCEVQIMPAHRFPASGDVWRIACRPDHSGWVEPLLARSMLEGSGFIYVGLVENMSRDLGDNLLDLDFDRFPDIGEEGEQMLVFTRRST